MSNPLEEPLNEFFNRITALDRVLQVIKSQGAFQRHTPQSLKQQPGMRSMPFEFRGIELTSASPRHNIMRSCTISAVTRALEDFR